MFQAADQYVISGSQETFDQIIQGISDSRCEYDMSGIRRMKKSGELHTCEKHQTFQLIRTFIISPVDIEAPDSKSSDIEEATWGAFGQDVLPLSKYIF